MLSVEDWAEIRRLHRAEGLPIKTIARTLGVSRNTVRAAMASDAPPKYERKPAGSAVDAFEDAIREQLELVPTMPATVIAERVGLDARDHGVQGAGRRAAAGVSAARPGLAHQLRGRRHRAVRLLVPADQAAGGLRADPDTRRSCRC